MEVHPLKRARMAACLKIKELSEMSGVSQSTICMIEKGRRRGSFNTYMALGRALGRDWHELVEVEQ